MEPIYRPDETKRIIEEIHDPLLRVEFNPNTNQWEVLKWMNTRNCILIPGSVVGLSSDIVKLYYSTGFYSVQMAFDHWGQYVFDTMRRGRPGFRGTKEIINDRKEKNEKIRQDYKDDMDERKEAVKKEVIKSWHPTIYSYSKTA
jgi:hypothetical protein